MAEHPFVASTICALRDSFEDIDNINELADELKDQRKLIEISESVGACIGYLDKDGPDGPRFFEIILIMAQHNGLPTGAVHDAIRAGCDRAIEAKRWREEGHRPKKKDVRPREYELPRSTCDALDWLLAHARDQLAEFITRPGRTRRELDAMQAYIRDKKK